MNNKTITQFFYENQGRIGARVNQIPKISEEYMGLFEDIVKDFSNKNERFFVGEMANTYECGAYYSTSVGENAFITKHKKQRHFVLEVNLRSGRTILSRDLETLEEAKNIWYNNFKFMPEIWHNPDI